MVSVGNSKTYTDTTAHSVHVDKYKVYMIALDRSPKAKGLRDQAGWVGEGFKGQVGAGPLTHRMQTLMPHMLTQLTPLTGDPLLRPYINYNYVVFVFGFQKLVPF